MNSRSGTQDTDIKTQIRRERKKDRQEAKMSSVKGGKEIKKKKEKTRSISRVFFSAHYLAVKSQYAGIIGL